ncbi:hypothetical protein PIROE2DRAFT_6503 [Piromyces sp. E2]|nr:hypothetical protein PIROE2DRAFT_6503 [Piromyces sp. E2]|eukprot:OUM66270.1 hypothetical protein PIROE2DRAFT_6503 [Piromyces sp. E2]
MIDILVHYTESLIFSFTTPYWNLCPRIFQVDKLIEITNKEKIRWSIVFAVIYISTETFFIWMDIPDGSEKRYIMIDFLNKILEFEENPIIDLIYNNTAIVPVKADKLLISKTKKNNNEEKETNQSNEEKEEKEVNDKEENSELYGRLGRMDLLVNPIIESPRVEEIIYPENIDLVAKTRTNQLINIEIQINNKGHMGMRSLYYASDIIFHSLPKNASYDKIPDLIMINILNYVAIKDGTANSREQFNNENEYNTYINELQNRCHSVYTIKNTQTNKTEIFENSLFFHFIELPKFLNEINENQLESEKYSWIKFLIEPEMYKNTNEKLFKKAYNYLEYLGGIREICEAYEQREKDEKGSFICNEEEGIKKGEKNEAVSMSLQLLKKGIVSLDEIKNYSKLSLDDLTIIDNFLNNSNRSIRELAISLNMDDINQLIKICENSDIYYIEKEEFDREKKKKSRVEF